MIKPIDVYSALKDKPFSFILESPNANGKLEQYSFVGYDPVCIIESRGNKTTITEHSHRSEFLGDPFTVIKNTLEKHKHHQINYGGRFCGGAVGYISYDSYRLIEGIHQKADNDLNLPDILLMIPGKIAIFDHLNNKIITNIDMKHVFESPVERPTITESVTFQSNMNKKDFEKIVSRSKEYIKNGDIYQVNLSQRFKANIDSDPFHIYRTLREVNPSPFASYFNFGSIKLASCSPERLVLLEDKNVSTRPIAGTRRRGIDQHEDHDLKGELILNEKERAEHLMLVDLGRNDIGRVCNYNSIAVDELMTVEKYSHVMHIVSNVSGTIHENCDQFDLFKAVFPGGTITGCPKIRSMEIIDKLEDVRRGPYTGAIGYFGFNGNMDMSITIRTIVMKDKHAYIQVGAGIVVDSVPELEYYETINKAKAMFEAIRLSHGAENVHLV